MNGRITHKTSETKICRNILVLAKYSWKLWWKGTRRIM